MDVHSLMMIFPVAFMIHDFEELCFLESWLKRNADSIRNRLTGNIWIGLEGHPTSALGITIMMMFLFVSVTTILSVLLNLYTLFAAAMIVFTAHNIFHILQPILLRRYIPAMGSSIVTLPYTLYVLGTMNHLDLFQWREAMMMSVLFGVFTFTYLAAAQRMGLWMDKRFNRSGQASVE